MVQLTTEDYLTVEDIAGRLKVHPDTVRDWLRTGALRGFRLKGRRSGWRIEESELKRFVEELKGGSQAEG